MTIHLTQNKEFAEHAISGVLIVNTKNREHHVLSIASGIEPEKYSYKLTTPQLVGPSTVTWVKLDLVDLRYFREEEFENKGASLYSFLSGFENNGRFKLKPDPSDKLSMLHLKVSGRIRGKEQVEQLLEPRSLRPFRFKDSESVNIPTKIRIECCPFSLTNTALFINHTLFGSVNYKTKSGKVYFSDTKYLDNNIGAVVTVESSFESIGLVGGALSKSNGDGELLVIVSWNAIFNLLKYTDFKFITRDLDSQSLLAVPTLSSNSRPDNNLESVVRISVAFKGGSYWGSGVIISNDTIITNKHVVEDHKQELVDLSITVPYRPTIKINLSDLELYSCPLRGFDLCFLKLKTSSSDLKPVRLCNFASEMKSSQVGQPVTSIGYGLFFEEDPAELRPFVSEGQINRVVKREWDSNCPEQSTMMIVSAACWNGSSGGGLFNRSGELVGLLTSNGRLVSGEIMPNFTLAIPINVITMSWSMLLQSAEPLQLTEKIESLWSLKNVHQDVHIDPLAWKL